MYSKFKTAPTRRLVFALLAFTLLNASCSDDDTPSYIDLSEIQARVKAKAIHPDLSADLFPSFLYLARGLQDYYKEETPEIFTDQILELSFSNPAKGTKLEFEMQESDVTEPSFWEYTTGEEDTIRTLFPVKWKREQLKSRKETTQLTFIWEVKINGQKAGDVHQTFTCHDIRHFPERLFAEDHEFVGFLKTDESGAIYPAALFSAYIQENHPTVVKLMQQAVADGAIERFDGYADEDERIENQLGAMWYVLLENGVTYGNHYFIPGYWSERHIRKLRNIDDVLTSKTGNCMELPMIIMAMCHQAGLKVVSYHVDNAPQDHMYMGILNSKGEVAYILNPAYMVRMDWKDKTREERIQIAKQQLIALLKVSKSDHEEKLLDIIIGTPHYEMVDFEKVRDFIPSLDF